MPRVGILAPSSASTNQTSASAAEIRRHRSECAGVRGHQLHSRSRGRVFRAGQRYDPRSERTRLMTSMADDISIRRYDRLPMARSKAVSAKPTFFATPAAFRAWLEKHHASAPELLVGFHKRDSGKPSITWPESVDEALCFGWIDGIRHSLGPEAYTIRFTPRKRTSIWSRINVDNVERLTKARRMRPAGLRAYALRTDARTGVYSFERDETAKLTSQRRGGAASEQDGCRVLRPAASLVSAGRDPLGHEREAGGDPRAQAGQTDREMCRRPADWRTSKAEGGRGKRA